MSKRIEELHNEVVAIMDSEDGSGKVPFEAVKGAIPLAEKLIAAGEVQESELSYELDILKDISDEQEYVDGSQGRDAMDAITSIIDISSK